MKNEILLHLGFYSSKFVHRPRLEILFRQCLGSAFDHFVYKHSTYFSQERNRKSSILLNIFFSISWMFIRVCQGQKSRASPYNRQSVYSHIKRTHTHIGAFFLWQFHVHSVRYYGLLIEQSYNLPKQSWSS